MSSIKVLFVVISYFSAGLCNIDLAGCDVPAKTGQGYVCGRINNATNGREFASFKGIPYAKPPLELLRFKELQPPEPFVGFHDASEECCACAQVDIFYAPRKFVSERCYSEDCICLNIHVPHEYLPDPHEAVETKRLLPVLVFIHGGSFSYGSGSSDFHGPQYLMTKDMILITVNYRLHVFGFMTLDDECMPGNNGLRDVITALKWVQENIRNFGGDPSEVTVGGQSAGAVMAHLLSISPATAGLFKQVLTLSGQSLSGFFSYSPSYSKLINTAFFTTVGINPLQSPKMIHDELVAMPLEKILHGQKTLLDLLGLVSFTPVIEKPSPHFTTVIPQDPEKLLDEGSGKDRPLLLGFCSNEAGTFEPIIVEAHLEAKMRLVPSLVLPQTLLFSADPLLVPALTDMHLKEYYNSSLITMKNFIAAASDTFYKYPGQRLTQKRLKTGAAKTYIYQFGYPGVLSPIKLTQEYKFKGAGHCEDLAYFFRMNRFLGPQSVENELAHISADNKMKDWMTNFIANFVMHGSPGLECEWDPSKEDLKFQNIETPLLCDFREPSPYMKEKIEYFTELYKLGLGE